MPCARERDPGSPPEPSWAEVWTRRLLCSHTCYNRASFPERGAGRERFRVGVDIGGTFTDIVLLGGDGRLHTQKVSSSVDDYARAIVEGLRRVFQETGLAGGTVDEVIHGTTVASNAIVERRGARTGLITTRSFRDVLEIRRRRMPRLYDLTGGRPSDNVLNPDSEARALLGKFIMTMKRDDVFRHDQPGPGGWGDPLERDPAHVLRDVRYELVGLASAREDYGVILDPATWTVEAAATAALRAELRARRGWREVPIVSR